jgi:hypothetical protein
MAVARHLFATRKRYVGVLLLAAEFAVNISYLPVLTDAYAHNRAEFWRWFVPYNVAIKLALLGIIGLFLVPYWRHHV